MPGNPEDEVDVESAIARFHDWRHEVEAREAAEAAGEPVYTDEQLREWEELDKRLATEGLAAVMASDEVIEEAEEILREGE